MSKSVIFQIFSEVEMFRKFTKILIAFSITILILSGCSSNESNFLMTLILLHKQQVHTPIMI